MSRLRHVLGRRSPAFLSRVLSTRASSDACRELDRILGGTRPVVAGPWVSEVGFELLYWIPLLARLRERGLDPSDVVAVTRGGAGAWYGHVAGRTVELLERLDPEGLKGWQDERRRRRGSEKQGTASPPERSLVADIARELGVDEAAVLHPSSMYRLFQRAWSWSGDLDLIERHTLFEPLPAEESTLPEECAPPSFVAVKAYFSACFPDTGENRRFLRTAVARLAERRPVVLLRAPVRLDDHLEPLVELENVVDAAPLLEPLRNLAQQTELVRRADALVTTYGGFSYLGLFLGVPTFTFYSHETFNRFHLRVHSLAAEKLERNPAAYPAATLTSQFDVDRLDSATSSLPR